MKKSPLHMIYKLCSILLIVVIIYVTFLIVPYVSSFLRTSLTILTVFLIAGFATYLLHPFVERLYEAGLHRGIAITIIYLLFFGGSGYAIYRLMPLFIEQMKDLSDHIPEFTEYYRSMLSKLYKETSHWPDGVQDVVENRIEALEKMLNQFLAKIIRFFSQVFNYLFLIAIIPFISFYLLKDIDQVRHACWYMTPSKWREQLKLFLKDVDESLGAYIRGQFFVCVIIGIVATLAFWLLKMKYPILLGGIVGITNIIPYFGPIIGALPALVIAFTMSIKSVIIVSIVILALQFLEGNILSPLIVGKSLNMHPIFIITALVIGGEFAGVIGLIVAVPLLAILKVAIMHGITHFSKDKEIVEKIDK